MTLNDMTVCVDTRLYLVLYSVATALDRACVCDYARSWWAAPAVPLGLGLSRLALNRRYAALGSTLSLVCNVFGSTSAPCCLIPHWRCAALGSTSVLRCAWLGLHRRLYCIWRYVGAALLCLVPRRRRTRLVLHRSCAALGPTSALGSISAICCACRRLYVGALLHLYLALCRAAWKLCCFVFAWFYICAA
jgi:hypothetical protein